MTTLTDHSRSLVACTAWADDRILTATTGITAEQWQQIRPQFEHMLGTQRWWHGAWTDPGATFAEPHLPSIEDARNAYRTSHEALVAFAERLTQDEWERAEPWWKQWGYEVTMPLGESITQLFYHGVQHRSEVAVVLSLWGHSPGDMDYLTFLRTRIPGMPED